MTQSDERKALGVVESGKMKKRTSRTPRRLMLGALALSATFACLSFVQPADAGIGRYLRVYNKTAESIDIYVDFGMVGTVAPHGTFNWHVGAKPGELTVIVGDNSTGKWGPRYIRSNASDYEWTLNP